MIRRPPRSTPMLSSAASDVYKRQRHRSPCRRLWRLCRDAHLILPVPLPLPLGVVVVSVSIPFLFFFHTFSLTSWQSLHSLRHGDQCWEDQADDKQHQWHKHRDQSEWTEAWDSHKLQISGLWGFQASRIAQTTAALTRLKPVWIDKSISFSSKIQLMCSLATSIFLHACESWTLTAELQRRTHPGH